MLICGTSQVRRRSYGGGFMVAAECCRGWWSGGRRKTRRFFVLKAHLVSLGLPKIGMNVCYGCQPIPITSRQKALEKLLTG
jgi:hypothetical protein